jgi:hypothetical protein
MIPYAVKSQSVTAKGFIRDEPSLFNRVMKRFHKWHEMRCDLHGASVNDNESIHKRNSVLDDLVSRSHSKFGTGDFDP